MYPKVTRFLRVLKPKLRRSAAAQWAYEELENGLAHFVEVVDAQDFEAVELDARRRYRFHVPAGVFRCRFGHDRQSDHAEQQVTAVFQSVIGFAANGLQHRRIVARGADRIFTVEEVFPLARLLGPFPQSTIGCKSCSKSSRRQTLLRFAFRHVTIGKCININYFNIAKRMADLAG